MKIPQPTLLATLRRILSHSPRISDWRKASGGHLVRYIYWRRAARRCA